MKRNPFGIETKTAASAGIGGLVTLVLLLNTWQHWFSPPPPDVTAAIEAFGVGVAGYFAKHTPRPPALQSAQERADFEEWTVAGKPLIRLPARPPAQPATTPALSPDWPDAKAYTQPAAPPSAQEGTTP